MKSKRTATGPRPQGKAAPAGASLPPRRPPAVTTGPTRAGRIAIVGRPNVGKSTLLNAALEQPLAIVSPVPQTTRDVLLGVVHHGRAELAFLDTPGLHRPRTELGRVMNSGAREAARSADVVVFVAAVPPTRDGGKRPLVPHPGDVTLLADIGTSVPTVLVVNKVDRAGNKSRLLPLLEGFGKLRDFAAILPISALRENDVAQVLDEVSKFCPEGAWQHGPDDVTDRPVRFFAAEYVREQILRATQAEVPHAAAVVIDRYVDPPVDETTGSRLRKLAIHIDATIYVERPGQKKIMVGAAGAMLKRIGTEARLRIEELTGQKVNLKLWVRVTPDWRDSASQLEELGYKRQGDADAGTLIVAEIDSDDADDGEPEDES